MPIVEELTPTPAPGQGGAIQRVCIYVVDANEASRSALVDMLAPRFDVCAFDSGDEAIKGLAHTRPEAVLLDVSLPGLGAVEVCRRMKEKTPERLLPVLLLTDGDADKALGLEGGADDFLRKPIGHHELRLRVTNLVKLAQFHRRQHHARARVKVLRSQLQAAERLATIGTFAGGVGHELNNIVTVLATAQDELQRSHHADEDVLDDLGAVTRQLKELATAVQHLAQPGGAETMVDLRDTLRDVLWVTRLTGRTKYVTIDYTPPAGPVLARLAPVDIQQMVLNLITNAAESLVGVNGARIGISLATVNALVVLRVIDNGPGYSPEALARLYEASPTATKGGSGMGLSLVRELVSRWGGSVDVITESGVGTTVELQVPVDHTMTG